MSSFQRTFRSLPTEAMSYSSAILVIGRFTSRRLADSGRHASAFIIEQSQLRRDGTWFGFGSGDMTSMSLLLGCAGEHIERPNDTMQLVGSARRGGTLDLPLTPKQAEAQTAET